MAAPFDDSFPHLILRINTPFFLIKIAFLKQILQKEYSKFRDRYIDLRIRISYGFEL